MGIARAVIFSRRVRLLAFLAAALGAFASSVALATAQGSGRTSAEPFAASSALPIVGDPRDARARNLELLDAIVFVLGVGILGGVLVWWGLRIYREK
jgi:hypothetical protein